MANPAARQTRSLLNTSLRDLNAQKLSNSTGRRIFHKASSEACVFLDSNSLEPFIGSPHYQYILELKTKEGIVPKLQDFQVHWQILHS